MNPLPSPEAQAAMVERLTHLMGPLDHARHLIDSELPPSRERSMVLTKLDEAALWLGAAVNRATDQ